MVIKSICISGGGPNVLLSMGALQYLHEKQFWKTENIETIYSTSAGCILSILISLNIEWKLVNNYIIFRPWEQAIHIDAENILNIFNSKGLFDKKILDTLLKPFFDIYSLSLDITLFEFYKYTNKELHFYTFELNEFSIIDISYITHPDLKLLDSIYMSCSIPILFKPICYNDKCYIDGGITTNYPLNFCLNKGYDKDEILAFRNIYNENNYDKKISNETNMLDFIIIFINKLVKNIDTENKQEDIKNVILCKVNHFDLDMFNNFVNSKDLRKNMIEEGILLGKDFLNYKSNI